VLADLPEDLLVAVEVTPPKVSVEHVARQIMRRHAIGPGLDEQQLPQPREHVVYVPFLEHVSQQRLGGAPGHRAGSQDSTVPTIGHRLHKPLKQYLDQVEGQHVGLHLTTPGDHISQQRQPEWMPVCEAHHPLVQVRVDACLAEQGPAVVGAEIAQRNHAQ